MPHAERIDERTLEAEAYLLLRSRIHIRNGWKRLRDGQVSLGIMTLYDALINAIRWYYAKHGLPLPAPPYDECVLYAGLVRRGVLDGGFDISAFNSLVEASLEFDLSEFDPSPVVAEMDSVFRQLAVVPFDERALPPET
jgi:hypothetical protein